MRVGVEPGALQPHRLFDDVADGTVAAITDGDVVGELLNFGGCVCRTAFYTRKLHHRIVGDIVAHNEYLFRFQSVLLQVLVENFDFVTHFQVHLHAMELLESHAHRLGEATGDDGDFVAFFKGVVQCVAVFDVGGAHLLAVGHYIDHPVRQHTVEIEDEGADFMQFFFVILHIFLGFPG